MLYVIAGASLSGKTTARRFITTKHSISGLDTDTLRTMTNILQPDIEVGHDKLVLENYRGMRATIDAFIFARSFFDDDYILEGDCINIEDVARGLRRGTIANAVVMGYPNNTVDERLAILRGVKTNHWSKVISQIELREKIAEFIEYSTFLEHEATKLGLNFIDVSYSTNLEDISKLIAQSLFEVPEANA